MRKICGAVILALVCITPVGAEYEAGQRAWDAGQRDAAIAEWQTGADAGETKSMLALGRLYLQGLGVPQNYIQAHMWFNLAASRGEAAAMTERDALAAKLTPEVLTEAQNLALAWQPGNVQRPASAAPTRTTEGVEIGEVFRDCATCPELVVVPAGSYQMGSPSSEEGRADDEGPVHRVTIAQPFAVGVYEVTFAEWDACVSGGGCNGHRPNDRGWGGRGRRPVINVSWEDARAYVAWLSRETGQRYRLLSEAEWEYVARAGTTTKYWWGDETGQNRANCYGCGSQWDSEQTAPVGSFRPNAFGLHDVHGNVWEWVQDCWNGNYAGAPGDGRAWEMGDCSRRVLRGGSWYVEPWYLRSALRIRGTAGNRGSGSGFRIARSLP